MIYVEAACLTGLVIIGFLSAYYDFRKGIIPNRLIVAGLTSSLCCHAVFLLLGAASYYPFYLLCMLIADSISLTMYFGKLWAAGDAKLFIVLFGLLPPRLFDNGQLSNGVSLYIFIFLPALIWMIGDSVIRLIHHEPRKIQRFNMKEWFVGCCKVIIEVTALHNIFMVIASSFVEENALLVFGFIMIYAYICSSTTQMGRWYMVLIHALVVASIWVLKGWSMQLPDYRGYLIMIAVMITQRIAGMYNYQLIPTANAVRGMIPAAETVLLFLTSKIQSLPTDPSEQLTAKMTEEQADAVRRWEKSAKGKPDIWIVRKVPFAFMIVLGFIAWIVLKIVG